MAIRERTTIATMTMIHKSFRDRASLLMELVDKSAALIGLPSKCNLVQYRQLFEAQSASVVVSFSPSPIRADAKTSGQNPRRSGPPSIIRLMQPPAKRERLSSHVHVLRHRPSLILLPHATWCSVPELMRLRPCSAPSPTLTIPTS